MPRAINEDNAKALQKKSVESRVRNHAIRYQNIRKVYMAGGKQGVMATYGVGSVQAGRLIKKFIK